MKAMSKVLVAFEAKLRTEDVSDAASARQGVRRLRALLVLATGRFDPDWVWLLRRELRWVEQAIGDVIDADALVCWIGRQPVDERDEPARASLVAELARERSRAQRRLVALLDSSRYERMVADLSRPYLAPEQLPRELRKEWRALKSLAKEAGGAPSDHDLVRMGARIDRLRFGAELDRDGVRWAEALASLREAVDGLQQASLAQGWLRHASGASTTTWDLLAGQLLERARAVESGWRRQWDERFDAARAKELRAWVKT
jgi:CHAD domain-containing protein